MLAAEDAALSECRQLMLQHHLNKAAYAGGQSTAQQAGSAEHPASYAPHKQLGAVELHDKHLLLEDYVLQWTRGIPDHMRSVLFTMSRDL